MSGEIDLIIRIGPTKASIRAFIVERLCSDGILSTDFIRKYNVIINMLKQLIWICGRSESLQSSLRGNESTHRKTVSLIPQERMLPHRNNLTPSRDHTSSRSSSLMQAAIQSIDNLIKDVCSGEVRLRLREILVTHVRLFDVTKPTIATTVKHHEIKTMNHPPPAQKAYQGGNSGVRTHGILGILGILRIRFVLEGLLGLLSYFSHSWDCFHTLGTLGIPIIL